MDKAFLENIMQLCNNEGVNEVALAYSYHKKYSADVEKEEIENILQAEDQSLTIEMFDNGRYSVNTLNRFDEPYIIQFIKQAREISRHLQPDNHRHLPDVNLFRGLAGNNLDLLDVSYHELDRNVLVNNLIGSTANLLRETPNVLNVTAHYTDYLHKTIKLHSNGFLGYTKARSSQGRFRFR
ncbi:MAG: hypothetical protein HC896_12900 [Bacteroidales bacterium]|nr:hypothetical protein [Bacteroidales bacterium]